MVAPKSLKVWKWPLKQKFWTKKYTTLISIKNTTNFVLTTFLYNDFYFYRALVNKIAVSNFDRLSWARGVSLRVSLTAMLINVVYFSPNFCSKGHFQTFKDFGATMQLSFEYDIVFLAKIMVIAKTKDDA